MDRALALEPDQPHFRVHSGRLAQDAGDAALAERDLRRATELKPGWVLAWLDLGTMLLDAQRPAEALDCLERAAALDATRARTWNSLGLALLELDRSAEARRGVSQRRSGRIPPTRSRT